MTVGNKTQKEYIRHLRLRRRVTLIISIGSVLLLFLYIVLKNPQNLTVWLVFAAYVLLIAILNHFAKQEFLNKDTETAKKESQERLTHNIRKKMRK
jgi:phosphatidylglycerophosphate synthase